MGQDKSRDHSFDALRGISILGVIGIHAILVPDNWDKDRSVLVSSWFLIFFRQLLNFSVPTFLFISGYFCSRYVVGSSWPDYFKFLKKRVSRVFVPYLIWSLILLIAFPLMKSKDVAWSQIPYELLTGGASCPYYFILLIIQMYILTPIFLRLIDLGVWGRLFLLAVNLGFLGSFYVTKYALNKAIPHELYILASTWLIFYCFGLYAGRNNDSCASSCGIKKWSILTLFFFGASCLEAWIVLMNKDLSSALSTIKLSSFLFSYSFLNLFLCLKSKFVRYPRLLILVGSYSFGIYLSHMVFLHYIKRALSMSSRLADMPILLPLLTTLLCVSICMSLIYISRRLFGRKLSSNVMGL